jgi:hypothetical protein
MRMHTLNGMNVTAKRDEVLEALRKNREEHAAIVKEAREGYVEKARAQVEKRLGQLREGKVVSLSFKLSPPQDHTKTYDTAIRMLELHTSDTVELTAEQVRCLVQDQWDWMDQFLVGTSAYSNLANAKLNG